MERPQANSNLRYALRCAGSQSMPDSAVPIAQQFVPLICQAFCGDWALPSETKTEMKTFEDAKLWQYGRDLNVPACCLAGQRNWQPDARSSPL